LVVAAALGTFLGLSRLRNERYLPAFLGAVLAATVGANIFGGRRDWSFFGQFDANDNVYLSVRFDF